MSYGGYDDPRSVDLGDDASLPTYAYGEDVDGQEIEKDAVIEGLHRSMTNLDDDVSSDTHQYEVVVEGGDYGPADPCDFPAVHIYTAARTTMNQETGKMEYRYRSVCLTSYDGTVALEKEGHIQGDDEMCAEMQEMCAEMQAICDVMGEIAQGRFDPADIFFTFHINDENLRNLVKGDVDESENGGLVCERQLEARIFESLDSEVNELDFPKWKQYGANCGLGRLQREMHNCPVNPRFDITTGHLDSEWNLSARRVD